MDWGDGWVFIVMVGVWAGVGLVDVVGDVGAGGYLIRPYGGDCFGLCCGMNIFFRRPVSGRPDGLVGAD
ncbi:hypothetical protein [Neisseria montereyensis]|uniref:Uncharacterized protein n=1 Tax=Neisseria montereyensis TaxID=2973938 RepID=A0ABT2FCD5_9NEIS|nr:hypothetical protein [Neisseria montereyensis]MCS4533193.1 hypothetical protein [Neisseria montereyensis]